MSYLPNDPREAYRRIRKDYPGLPARQAWLWAKGAHSSDALKWRASMGHGLDIISTTLHRDGFDVVVTLSYDDSGYGKVSDTDVDTGIRNKRFRWDGDGYKSARGGQRWLELDSGNTVRELAKYYNEAGAAKHVAWEDARVSLQKEADALTEQDHSEYVISATASRNGIELGGSSSVGGFETDGYQSLEDLGAMAIEETDVVEEAAASALHALQQLLATA